VVDETGKGDFQVEVKAGTSTFLMDEPVQAGGLGSDPNPYDLLSAAIGARALRRYGHDADDLVRTCSGRWRGL
jgi:hypothetical protein